MGRNLQQKIVFLSFAIIMCGLGKQEVFAQRAVIALDGVEIYSLPMVDKNPTVVLSKGDTVRVIGQRGGWVKVEFAKGKKGWMQVQVNGGKNERIRSKKTQKRRADRLSSKGRPSEIVLAKNGIERANGISSKNGKASNRLLESNGSNPDIDIRKPRKPPESGKRSQFGYSFGLGLLETDFAYEWKFLFHTSPRLALVGLFKHALGAAANSYFLMANWDYLLKEKGDLLPYITGGMGIINTVPERSIVLGSVSNMVINYGIGARKKFKGNTTLNFKASANTVFVGKGVRHYKEFTVGFMVGKFWD